MESIWLILIGLITGYIGGYAGIGGAPFIILVLKTILGYSQHTAQGTVLAIMLGPMSLMGIIAMKDKVKYVYKYAILGSIVYMIFSYIGASLAFLLNTSKMSLYFSLFIFVLGIYQILDIDINNIFYFKQNNISIKNMINIGIIVGVIGGLFGIGAGLLMVPIFTDIYNMKKDFARLLSLLILLPPVSLGAVIKYSSENAIVWKSVIIIFVCYFITNYYGSKIGLKHSDTVFKKYYGYILIFISVINFFIIR